MIADIQALLCPSCGAPVANGEVRCGYCGSALFSASTAQVVVPALADEQKIIAKMHQRIEANPYDGEAFYQLGLACFTLQLFEQAENSFRQADRYLPGNALVHYFLGLTILKRNENDILSIREYYLNQISQEFKTAIKLDPNLLQARPYMQFIEALIARDRKDYASTIGLLESVADKLPAPAPAYKVLAACAFQNGDYPRAIEAANRAWDLCPGDLDVAFLLGAAFARLDDTESMNVWAKRVARLRNEPDRWQDVVDEYRGKFD
jgi:tetratricopeptide (TPR) repeat protein